MERLGEVVEYNMETDEYQRHIVPAKIKGCAHAEWNGVTKKLADAVTGYYIGDGIVVYCQNQRMFCYFVEKDLTLPLSKEDKKAMMIGGANGIVFWYDITQTYERDIVKYAEVNSSSWRK